MRLEELDFDIPEELIAQEPATPRDSCRLMFLPAGGEPQHFSFSDLPTLLMAGDCLVFNDSRVLPARMEARKPTGGKVELLFLKQAAGEDSGELWEVLARPSHRLRAGTMVILPGGERVVMERPVGEGRWIVSVPSGTSGASLMERYGRLPLPPYIKIYPARASAYQTVYARRPGSAAAPTAGLHFTRALLGHLEAAGVKRVYVTLHVGLDTFQPIREPVVEQHTIHREDFLVTATALKTLREVRKAGGRVVAVGTTSARVLETLAQQETLFAEEKARDLRGSTSIYITPGYRFRAVDVLLTNFHLPRSTVLAMTMAFAGVERLRAAYAEAVGRRYRFFSFGDAMLIEPLTAGPLTGGVEGPGGARA